MKYIGKYLSTEILMTRECIYTISWNIQKHGINDL